MYEVSQQQPFINLSAFIRSLAMWLVSWVAVAAFVSYQGQPGVICMTPMAWLLAIPAGLNYVAFAKGRPGKSPFLAGFLLGALLGLALGLVFFAIAARTMPDDPPSAGTLTTFQLSLIITGAGAVISALLGGFMAWRAASLQRRGKQLTVVRQR